VNDLPSDLDGGDEQPEERDHPAGKAPCMDLERLVHLDAQGVAQVLDLQLDPRQLVVQLRVQEVEPVLQLDT
jgi:hypothetical protein